ncbi:mCG146160, partial [Mus musculus]
PPCKGLESILVTQAGLDSLGNKKTHRAQGPELQRRVFLLSTSSRSPLSCVLVLHTLSNPFHYSQVPNNRPNDKQ